MLAIRTQRKRSIFAVLEITVQRDAYVKLLI